MGLLSDIKELAKKQYAQGAPYRAAVGGLLSGDVAPMAGLLNQKTFVNPMSTQEAMDMAMNYGPMALGTIGKVAKLTEFEKAQLKAQKNAVEMLGLPANNTAMDRAKAMGYTTPAFHGTDKSFDQFNPALSDSARKTGTPDGAMVVTSNPQTAATYGMDYAGDFTTKYKDGANVMPLLVNKGKNMNMNASDGSYTPNWNDIYNPKYPDIQTTNDFAALALAKGKDSATIKNVKDNARMSSAEGDTTFLFKPENIRSKYAAFDPAKRNSSDLMGFADPRLLAYIAGGGLGGIAYNNKK
jgi:hypothetical protein